MIVVDATLLVMLIQPEASGPTDEKGAPVAQARERIEHLVAELERTSTKVGIPTPALSEALIRVGPKEAHRVVEALNRRAVFVVQSFDQRAAIEVAAMLREELGSKRPRSGPETWAKLKYDRQIMAIAKVCGATAVYSDDRGLRTLGDRFDIPVLGVGDLPLPPGADQVEILFDSGDDEDEQGQS